MGKKHYQNGPFIFLPKNQNLILIMKKFCSPTSLDILNIIRLKYSYCGVTLSASPRRCGEVMVQLYRLLPSQMCDSNSMSKECLGSQTGVTQYHAQLLTKIGRAITWLVVCNDWDLEPLDLLNGLALGC